MYVSFLDWDILHQVIYDLAFSFAPHWVCLHLRVSGGVEDSTVVTLIAAVPERDAAGAAVPAQQLPAEERHYHDQVDRQPRQGGNGNMGQYMLTLLETTLLFNNSQL